MELMFPGPESSKRVVVQCKGCGENIPAPVATMPSQPIAVRVEGLLKELLDLSGRVER
jgi:hypothetical protein